MFGADVMDVERSTPVFKTALQLLTERFGSMELMQEHMKTVKEVKHILLVL